MSENWPNKTGRVILLSLITLVACMLLTLVQNLRSRLAVPVQLPVSSSPYKNNLHPALSGRLCRSSFKKGFSQNK
jgi:hypothetical protein